MNYYHHLPTDDMLNLYSDWHKDFYGVRPRCNLSRTEVLKNLVCMQEHFIDMCSTERGREELRKEGWNV